MDNKPEQRYSPTPFSFNKDNGTISDKDGDVVAIISYRLGRLLIGDEAGCQIVTAVNSHEVLKNFALFVASEINFSVTTRMQDIDVRREAEKIYDRCPYNEIIPYIIQGIVCKQALLDIENEFLNSANLSKIQNIAIKTLRKSGKL